MRQFHLKAEREAVDFALRRAAGSTATTEGPLSLEGIGWDGWPRGRAPGRPQGLLNEA